jgi:hypothetical protein
MGTAIFRLFFVGRLFYGHFDGEGQLYYLLARSFNTYGYLKLGFIPVINSGPLTSPPDYYAHWPIIYPNILAIFLKIFGDTVYVGRVFSVFMVSLGSYYLYSIASIFNTRRFGFYCLLAFALTPALLYYGVWVGRTLVCITFWLAGVYYFILYDLSNGEKKKYLIISCIWLFLASLTSWEPLVTASGFFIIMFLRRETYLRKGAIWCIITLIMAFVVHHVHILLVAPDLLLDQIGAVMKRTYTANSAPRFSLVKIFMFGCHIYLSYGVILLTSSLCGTIIMCKAWRRSKLVHDSNLHEVELQAHKSKVMPYMILLVSLPLGWFLIMVNQAFNHDYEYLLWAPFIAITAGVFWNSLSRMAWKKTMVILPLCFVLLIVDTSISTMRYFQDKVILIEGRDPRVFKGFFKESDVFFVDSFGEAVSTAYLTGNHVRWVSNPKELIEFLSSKSPPWATGYYFIYGDSDAKVNEANQDNSYQRQIKWLKSIFEEVRIYKPIVRDRSPLAKWLMENFSPKILPTGLVVFDLTDYKDSIKSMGPQK